MVQQVILERDAELAALAAAVAAAEAGHGCLVLVEGPAGIGKTTLLRAACREPGARVLTARGLALDRKSTRLNSSHVAISYAVFCLKKKTAVLLGERAPYRLGHSHPTTLLPDTVHAA